MRNPRVWPRCVTGALRTTAPPISHSRGHVQEGDLGREVADLHRRERRGDVTPEAVLQRLVGVGRSPDEDPGVGAEAGGEEHQALDVVEVKVGEQQVDHRRARAAIEGQAELADAGAGVEHDQGPVPQRDLHAGGVAAVAHRLRAGRGDGAARAPDPDSHLPVLRERPEEGHRAARALGRHDRQRAHLDVVLGAIERADAQAGVRRRAVAQRDRERELVDGHVAAVAIERPDLPPHRGARGAHVLEATPEQMPRGVVVEDERPGLVGEKGRRREARHQVAGQDELQRALGGTHERTVNTGVARRSERRFRGPTASCRAATKPPME